MSIFNFSKKQKEEEKVEDKKTDKPAVAEKQVKTATPKENKVSEINTNSKASANIIIRPRVTEKATVAQEGNAYVFEIFADANKKDVFKAVREIYKIEPKKVNIVKSPSKTVFIRGKRGVKPGVKKAYVYLKEGDKIEIV